MLVKNKCSIFSMIILINWTVFSQNVACIFRVKKDAGKREVIKSLALMENREKDSYYLVHQ